MPISEFVVGSDFELDFWYGGGTLGLGWSCDASNSVASVKIALPSNILAILSSCFAPNTPGTCSPSCTPGPQPGQSFSVDCCPCATGGCGTGSGSSPNAYGAICTTSPATGTGIGGTNGGASTSSGGGQTCSSTILDEFVTESGETATVTKCDCGVHRYYCRIEVSSLSGTPLVARLAGKSSHRSASPAYIYQSVGNNTYTLIKYDDDTFTETQDDGSQHDYLANGQIYRIRKTTPHPGIWTIVRDSGPPHIIDPFLRRTMFSYDGNGHLSSIEDPFGRTTNYSYSAGGLLEEYTTPELCQTEYLYDNDNQIKAIIAPDGLRTTYGWDVDGRCNKVQTPDGGITTYNYVSGSTTVVTDPLGNVTTLLYDAVRNKVGEIKPLSNRTTYIYDRQVLTAVIPPVGGRTTYTYKEFDQNVRRMETEQTPFGRTTYVYDVNQQHIATVSPLGERTTLVRNVNDAVIAEARPRTFLIGGTCVGFGLAVELLRGERIESRSC